MINLGQIKLQQVVQISSFPSHSDGEMCYFSSHLLGFLVKLCFVSSFMRLSGVMGSSAVKLMLAVATGNKTRGGGAA